MVVNLAVFLYFLLFSIAFENLPEWHSRGQRFDIGEGSIVGAGSVVVKPIPPYSLAVGCPAKVIKKREG